MLTLVLALPAFIVLFLHSFGENHFELPYYVPAVDSTGKVVFDGKDTVFYQVRLKNQDSIRAVAFFEQSGNVILNQHFSRVKKLLNNEISLELVKGDSATLVDTYKLSNLKNAKTKQTIPYNEQFVLIDKQGYIRGFYDGKDEKEVERLITEINVLLDIYQKKEN